jgi:hypothetical protein
MLGSGSVYCKFLTICHPDCIAPLWLTVLVKLFDRNTAYGLFKIRPSKYLEWRIHFSTA